MVAKRPVHASESSAPIPMHTAAVDNLRYIRNTIDAARTFSLVPGRACIAMGLVGLVAAGLELLPQLAGQWLPIWLAAAVLAVTCAVFEMVEKARQEGISLWRSAGLRFFMTLAPAFLVGAILTAALVNEVGRDVLAGIWMLTYGAGLVASGVYSLPVVTLAGGMFLGFGTVALTAPPQWAPFLLALSFGGIHLILGILVVRRHGG